MHSKKAILAVMFVLYAASMACTNPIASYFSTRTAVMETATATMWTPTPTNTPTATPTPTATATPTNTLTPTPDNRFYETGGAINFSYVPPIGWKKSKASNGIYQWAGKGTTVLQFQIQESSSDAASAGALAETSMGSIFPGAKIIDEGALSPDSGLDAFFFIFSAPYSGLKIHAEIYIFSGNGFMLEGIYLRPDDSDADQDPLVKDCMLTMRFD